MKKKKVVATVKNPDAKNNPYGANGVIADPRQMLFFSFYLDPKSPTFSNASKSGLKAGFSREYSENIMSQMPDWLSEKLGSLSPMLLKAERNIDESLDLPSKVPAMGAFGPLFEKEKVRDGSFKNGKPKYKTIKKPIMVYSQGLIRLKNESSMFVAERIGRKTYGKDVDPSNVFNNFIFVNGQKAKIAKRFLGGGHVSDRSGETESN